MPYHMMLHLGVMLRHELNQQAQVLPATQKSPTGAIF